MSLRPSSDEDEQVDMTSLAKGWERHRVAGAVRP
jgi:hypothetical protein